MTYKEHQVVNILLNGYYVKGTILEKCRVSDDSLWWVQIGHECGLYEEKDLNLWNFNIKQCECGSDSLGHPGHSDFCPKFVA